MKKLELENKRFGETLVISRDKINGKRWLCRCDCGAMRTIPAQSLLKGESKRCKKCSSLRQVITDRLPKTIFYRMVRRAKIANLEFSVSAEELYALFLLQNKKCKLSNLPISLIFDKNRKLTASIDRIDSKEGYTKNNIQWVHKDINFIKQDYAQDYFINLCKAVAESN
jgi:hypothetical protein